MNGFLVQTVEQGAAPAEAAAGLDRTLCRRAFDERFTAARMAKSYIGVYQGLMDEAAWRGILPVKRYDPAELAAPSGRRAALEI